MFGNLVVGMMALAVVAVANGAQRHVPGKYSTIQSAINAAAEGDEIVVAPGTYTEAIDFLGKAITIISSSGPDVTIIDASGLGQVSTVKCVNGENEDSVLDGFTITGGSGTFEDSRRKGGGMFNKGSSPTVINCVFTQNVVAAYEFEIEGSGAGMYNEDSDPTVIGTKFAGNQLLGCSGYLNGGGGMYNDQSDPIITNTSFVGNYANNGGGIMNVNGSHPTITNTVFDGNTVAFSGGGLNNTTSSGGSVVNSLFTGNTAFHGAGVYVYESGLTLVNSTLTGNAAEKTAGGLYLMYASDSPTVNNSIFWDNTAEQYPSTKEIDRLGGVNPAIDHNTVDGGWEAGFDNHSVNPLFVDAATGDFRLSGDSPCVNAGHSADVPTGVSFDLDGNDRIAGAAVDHGAYELPLSDSIAGDVNGDGIVNVDDLGAVIVGWGACPNKGECPADLNSDGVVNVDDLGIVVINWS